MANSLNGPPNVDDTCSLINKSILYYRKGKDLPLLIEARRFVSFMFHFVLSFELATVRMMIIPCILVDATNILVEQHAFRFHPHSWTYF
jgi:hypothetical protein